LEQINDIAENMGTYLHSLRVNGTATLHIDDPLLPEYLGAQLIVRVRAEHIFPNWPRYIHKMQLVEYSVYVPTRDHHPPEPDWKKDEAFCDALPRDKPGIE
jgi:uncharacterized protein